MKPSTHPGRPSHAAYCPRCGHLVILLGLAELPFVYDGDYSVDVCPRCGDEIGVLLVIRRTGRRHVVGTAKPKRRRARAAVAGTHARRANGIDA
jgi:predicted RNA-binding Zn-ribbon protein involved in translation (DUF1610 family)